MRNNDYISELPSDKGLDLLAKVLPHLDVILHDDDYNSLKNRMQKNKNLKVSDIMGDAYEAIAMKNRTALYGIVSAVTGKELEDITQQPLEETLSVFQGVMSSRILDFFIFCARMAVKL